LGRNEELNIAELKGSTAHAETIAPVTAVVMIEPTLPAKVLMKPSRNISNISFAKTPKTSFL
jgi:hypothetical protein